MKHNNKTILEKANAAITKGDYEGFLEHCTEDTVWTFVGEQTLNGKDAVRQWMATAYMEPPKFKVSQLLEDGEFVVAIGTITTKDDSGKEAQNAYCDVWWFSNGKMAELTAYVIATGD